MTEQKPSGLNQFPFKKGLYTVTKVFCTQMDCLDRAKCHDTEGVCGEIGLQEDDPGCYMICHEYTNLLAPLGIVSDKKVYWARKYPYDEMRPVMRKLVSKIAMNIDPDVTIERVRIGEDHDKKRAI